MEPAYIFILLKLKKAVADITIAKDELKRKEEEVSNLSSMTLLWLVHNRRSQTYWRGIQADNGCERKS